MLTDILPYLRCPHCAQALDTDGTRLFCISGHSFDIARQGYVNLAAGGGSAHKGDDSGMVSARHEFLQAGHFAGLRDAIVEMTGGLLCRPSGPTVVVDIGAGTGYYLAALLNRAPQGVGIALDSSRPALQRAAHAHPLMGAVGCDVWGPLPLVDGCAHLILDVFSPRNAKEFARVLRPDGRLLVVTPTLRHLEELVGPLGLVSVDEDKPRRLKTTLTPPFVADTSSDYLETLSLREDALTALVGMGPSARHLDAQILKERVSYLREQRDSDTVEVSVSVTIATYRLA